MELILIRNYPGMRREFCIRRVVWYGDVAGFVKRGRFHEINEALYAVSVTSLIRLWE